MYACWQLQIPNEEYTKPRRNVTRTTRIWSILPHTMIASVSFVLTGNLICNFPQTREISNF